MQLLMVALIGFGDLQISSATENNLWPFFHQINDNEDGRRDEISSLGPLFGKSVLADGTDVLSVRPFYTSFDREAPLSSNFHFLYPVFNYYHDEDSWNWHTLNLISMRKNIREKELFFQAFPFIFYNKTQDPRRNYAAFWPIGGVLKNRFWRDRIEFALWPLYVRTVKGDEVRTHTPYPFIQRLKGPESRGFGIWPFFGHFERDGAYSRTWALWPIYYDYKDKLDLEVPYERFGVWPLYHRETAAGLKSESFLWPFFGYTREWDPRPTYSETRYFWPFIVQGRGEEKIVNRLLPLYAYEWKPDYQKRWYLWPLLKTEKMEASGFTRERTSLLYFIFRDEKQYLRNGVARKTFFWPFAGYWNDGNGHKQFQMLDPLGVFFPRNEKVRENWSPLFSLYRYDSRHGNTRHSLLWNMVVMEKDITGTGALYLGPLFEYVNDGSTGHWQILKGLIGVERDNGRKRLLWLWR